MNAERMRFARLIFSISLATAIVFAPQGTLVPGRFAAAAAPLPNRSVLVPIQTYVRAANAGQRSVLISAFTPDSTILDEFAPFAFTAPNAAAKWYDGFGADQRANAVTGAVIAYSTPKFVSVEGSRAYVVLPTVYTYKLKGKPARESGSLAFAVRRVGAQWKIASMAWAKLTDTSIP